MKSAKWTFYKWTWSWRKEDTFEKVKDSYLKWPVQQFEQLADKLGFDHLETDQTLVGGYFANNNGECLICVPAFSDPKKLYS